MKKIIAFVVIATIISNADAKIMKKMSDVENVLSRPSVTPTPKILPMPYVDQDAIKKRLDEQLSAPVESKWNDSINDLFDLAMVNRELARDYFIKMRSKMENVEVKPIEVEKKSEKSPEINLPAGEEPMKKATGRPAPSRKPVTPKEESTEVPSGEEPMKKGAAPAPKKGAPRGGPAKNIGGGTKSGAAKPGVPAKVAPKVAEQIFSVSKLQQLENNTLLELFNDLLEKLGTVPSNWNGMVVEKVEEKTKYGQKIYNVYGAPVDKWKNDINTLKKVMISKNIMPEADITQKIADRIIEVRAEKNVKPATTTQPEEKPKEELTEDDLIKLIKAQMAEPKADQIGWVVSIKGNIKALDKLNHDEAMKYHDQFIKLTKEKPFLK